MGRIDHDPAVAEINPVVGDIPGGEVRPDVIDSTYARRQSCERIEISLIRVAIAIDMVVAPFDASFPPPLDDGNSIQIVADANPSDIVGPEPTALREDGGGPMREDSGRR